MNDKGTIQLVNWTHVVSAQFHLLAQSLHYELNLLLVLS